VDQGVVLTTDDRVLNQKWAIAAARDRLAGAKPVLLPGSHSPFLSRPAALADILANQARRQPSGGSVRLDASTGGATGALPQGREK
jgi:hypothetical protein